MYEVLKTQQSENLCLSEEFGWKPVPKTHTKEMTERISNSNHPGFFTFLFFFCCNENLSFETVFLFHQNHPHIHENPAHSMEAIMSPMERWDFLTQNITNAVFYAGKPPHSSAAHPKETRIRADLGGFWGGGWTKTFKKNMLVNMASSSPVFGEKIPKKQLNKTHEETEITTYSSKQGVLTCWLRLTAFLMFSLDSYQNLRFLNYLFENPIPTAFHHSNQSTNQLGFTIENVTKNMVNASPIGQFPTRNPALLLGKPEVI